jgi:hypothetical protein
MTRLAVRCLSALAARLCNACSGCRRLPAALGGRQAAGRDGLRRGESAARQVTATRRCAARQPRGGSRRDSAATLARTAARPHGEMAARPLPDETAEWRDGRWPGRTGCVTRRPRGNQSSGRAAAFGGGLSPKCTRRDCRAAAARQLGETPRRDIRAARPCGEGRDRRTSKRPRGETAARRDSRVATAQRD